MPAIVLPFPVTALPGRRPGEGQGDLINCFARKVGAVVRWQRVPGTERFTPNVPATAPPTAAPRGQLVVEPYLLSVWGDKVVRTTADGTEEVMAGTIPGVGPVTLARNLATPVDVVAVSDGGAHWLDLTDGTTGTIKAYPAPTVGIPLGNVNSVDYFSGYFAFSRPTNEIVVSNLQTMDFDALSFARAEAAPDTLLRMFASPPVLLACGRETIEVYQDVGASPFPYQRVTVIPCGLIGPWAIAGGGRVWDRPVCFVAQDNTVRQLRGYDPIIVSPEDVAFDIEAEAEAGRADQLVAQAYTHGDNAIWSLSSPSWTWEYNLSTTGWHRRRSYQPTQQQPDFPVPWRAKFAALLNHCWYAQDELDGGLVEITSRVQDEPSIKRGTTTYLAPLIARCESGPAKEMPANIRAPVIYLDFTVGHDVLGTPDPSVMLSWSHDGGATWSNPLRRTLGGEGEFRRMLTLRNIGRSSHHGLRLRWECVDPVPLAFHGGLAPTAQPSRPRQVGVVVQAGGVNA